MMIKLKSKILILLLNFSVLSLYAQVADNINEPPPILLHRQFTAGISFNTLGWGINTRYGIFKNINHDKIFEFDYVNSKNPKETRVYNPTVNDGSYVYGKMNDYSALRFGLGYQKLWFNKGEKNGVEIRYHLSGGLSAALLKPVYLNIISGDGTDGRNIEKYNPELHFSENISGGADFIYGLDEMKLRPGAYGKFALVFEWAEDYEIIKTLEAGLVIDAYPNKLPIMAFIDNRRIYPAFYLALHFGNRW